MLDAGSGEIDVLMERGEADDWPRMGIGERGDPRIP